MWIFASLFLTTCKSIEINFQKEDLRPAKTWSIKMWKPDFGCWCRLPPKIHSFIHKSTTITGSSVAKAIIELINFLHRAWRNRCKVLCTHRFNGVTVTHDSWSNRSFLNNRLPSLLSIFFGNAPVCHWMLRVCLSCFDWNVPNHTAKSNQASRMRVSCQLNTRPIRILNERIATNVTELMCACVNTGHEDTVRMEWPINTCALQCDAAHLTCVCVKTINAKQSDWQ